MTQIILSIGREYGSGGHEIATKLAEIYKLPLYDHNILDEIAAKKNLDVSTLEEYDEKETQYISDQNSAWHDKFTGEQHRKPSV